MILTFILIGIAYYKVYKDRKKTGPWGIRILHGTTILCFGLVIYTLIYK